MKRKLMQIAIGMSLALSASAAMAFNPIATTGAVTPAYQVFISGSSAVSSTVKNFIIDNVCAHDSTQDPAGIYTFARTDDWAVACYVNNATTGAVSQPVLFIKRDAGGSGYGVTPVTNAVPIAALEVSAANCTGSAAPKTTQTQTNTPYNEYSCSSGSVTLTPDAGFSDVEPDKFKGFNAPSGLPDFDPSKALAFTAQPVAALVGGVPVSLNLRNALQAVQFPSSSVCNPSNSGYAANAETRACMPSLTGTEIRSIFTGSLGSWDKFTVTNASGAQVAMTSITGTNAASLSDHIIEICRRTPGSGTQASFGMVFLNAPCDPNAAPPIDYPGNPPFLGGPVVADNSGSGDLVNCLSDYNDGTNVSGQNAGGTGGAAQTRWAIGLNFTTGGHNEKHAKNWRFIKVNGKAPTLQNVVAGDYEYYAEESFQWRTDIATLTNSTSTADKDDTIKMLQYIASTAVSPTALGNLNKAYVYPWGDGGWLAIPSATYAPRNPFDPAYPVNTSTRSPFGQGPNTCQLPVNVTTEEVDNSVVQ